MSLSAIERERDVHCETDEVSPLIYVVNKSGEHVLDHEGEQYQYGERDACAEETSVLLPIPEPQTQNAQISSDDIVIRVSGASTGLGYRGGSAAVRRTNGTQSRVSSNTENSKSNLSLTSSTSFNCNSYSSSSASGPGDGDSDTDADADALLSWPQVRYIAGCTLVALFAAAVNRITDVRMSYGVVPRGFEARMPPMDHVTYYLLFVTMFFLFPRASGETRANGKGVSGGKSRAGRNNASRVTVTPTPSQNAAVSDSNADGATADELETKKEKEKPRARMHWLDNLRTWCIFWVITGHTFSFTVDIRGAGGAGIALVPDYVNFTQQHLGGHQSAAMTWPFSLQYAEVLLPGLV